MHKNLFTMNQRFLTLLFSAYKGMLGCFAGSFCTEQICFFEIDPFLKLMISEIKTLIKMIMNKAKRDDKKTHPSVGTEACEKSCFPCLYTKNTSVSTIMWTIKQLTLRLFSLLMRYL